MAKVMAYKNSLHNLLSDYFNRSDEKIECKRCGEKIDSLDGCQADDKDFRLCCFYFRHVRLHGSRDELAILKKRWDLDKYVLL